jgi:hypothetical protein
MRNELIKLVSIGLLIPFFIQSYAQKGKVIYAKDIDLKTFTPVGVADTYIDSQYIKCYFSSKGRLIKIIPFKKIGSQVEKFGEAKVDSIHGGILLAFKKTKQRSYERTFIFPSYNKVTDSILIIDNSLYKKRILNNSIMLRAAYNIFGDTGLYVRNGYEYNKQDAKSMVFSTIKNYRDWPMTKNGRSYCIYKFLHSENNIILFDYESNLYSMTNTAEEQRKQSQDYINSLKGSLFWTMLYEF